MGEKLFPILRKLAVLGAVVAVGAVWANTLKLSMASNEWQGVWSSAANTRGKKIDPRERTFEVSETVTEREKRLKRERQLELGVGDALRDVKQKAFGAKAPTRGDDIEEWRQELPPGFAEWTTREVCLQQQLDSDDFADEEIDCFSSRYDGDVPWLDGHINGSGEDPD